MGERQLAAVREMKAVASACHETIKTMVEPADEAMRVNTPGGVFSVRWDARGSATALGQLAFFAEYLEATGLFERWLKSMSEPTFCGPRRLQPPTSTFNYERDIAVQSTRNAH